VNRGYYFVVPSLPPLSLKAHPEMSFMSLIERLKICLSKKDWEKTKVLRLFIDLCNIRALFLEEEIDPHGNLNEKELDEALLVQEGLPEYVFFFLSQFEKVPDKVRNFSGLLSLFFNEEIPKQTGFLKQYLQFEREVRLVLVGLRAKALGRNLIQELQFEDPREPFVAHLLAQNDTASYDPPSEYASLKELVASCYQDPLAEYENLQKFRFEHWNGMVEGEFFSLDQILCYMAQLMAVESFFALDAIRGSQILDTFRSG